MSDDILTSTVLCDDCDERKQDLQATGFEVIGCDPDADQSGLCVIRFKRSASASAAAAPGTLTATQAQVAKAIVNLFETGEVLGHYGAVTVLQGDTGHLTYGRSQTTLGSGNLHELIARYCASEGARFARRLEAWLPGLKRRDVQLDGDARLHNVLRACADDAVMRDTQDVFFDETYWEPALRAARKLGVRTPLGIAIVYDSWVHGSWAAMRDRTDGRGVLQDAGERVWMARYVQTRRAWLASHPNTLLCKTVYRMDAFQRLIDQDLWALPLPLVVRDREISLATLQAMPPGCYDGPQPGTRSLAVHSPLQRGLDVRLLQLGLSDRGRPIRADGIFGNTSAEFIRAFQKEQGLPATGVADAALISVLVPT
jgi:chitosanase